MSDPEDRWRELDALMPLLDLPPDERAAFLDAKCPPELRARVDALLRVQSGRLDTFLPAGAALSGSIANSLFDDLENGEARRGDGRPGAMIDGYRLLRRLGEGGMGRGVGGRADGSSPPGASRSSSWKPGLTASGWRSALESERWALALANHRNVAQVFGGGSTPRAGRTS